MALRDRSWAMQGGLDLTTPKNQRSRRPGGLILDINYEPRDEGYRRIDGFERFDGGPSPSDLEADQSLDDADRPRLVAQAREAIGEVPGEGDLLGVWSLHAELLPRVLLTDLVNGQGYKIKVRGVDSTRIGAVSPESDVVTPVASPLLLTAPDLALTTFPDGGAATAVLPAARGGTAPYAYVLTRQGGGVTFDPATRTITVQSHSYGRKTMTYEVRDAAGATSSDTFELVYNTWPLSALSQFRRVRYRLSAVEPELPVTDDATPAGWQIGEPAATQDMAVYSIERTDYFSGPTLIFATPWGNLQRIAGALPPPAVPDIERRTRTATGVSYGPWGNWAFFAESETTPPASPTAEYRLIAGAPIPGSPRPGPPDIERRTRSATGASYGPWGNWGFFGEGSSAPPATPTEQYRLVPGPDIPGTPTQGPPDIQRRTRTATGVSYGPWGNWSFFAESTSVPANTPTAEYRRQEGPDIPGTAQPSTITQFRVRVEQPGYTAWSTWSYYSEAPTTPPNTPTLQYRTRSVLPQVWERTRSRIGGGADGTPVIYSPWSPWSRLWIGDVVPSNTATAEYRSTPSPPDNDVRYRSPGPSTYTPWGNWTTASPLSSLPANTLTTQWRHTPGPSAPGPPSEGPPDIERRTRSASGSTYSPWSPWGAHGEGFSLPPNTLTAEYRLVLGGTVPGSPRPGPPDIQRRSRTRSGGSLGPWSNWSFFGEGSVAPSNTPTAEYRLVPGADIAGTPRPGPSDVQRRTRAAIGGTYSPWGNWAFFGEGSVAPGDTPTEQYRLIPGA